VQRQALGSLLLDIEKAILISKNVNLKYWSS
jgi:hypothetical protein